MPMSCLRVGPIQANCYLIQSDAQSQGVIIDPGGDPGRIAAQCAQMGFTPAAILITHGHFDHVGGVAGLLEKYPAAQVYCHPGDVGQIPQATWQPPQGTLFLEDGQDLTLAGLTFHVYHTPGHSKGSVTFRWDRALFTGDTLFQGSMGRTDFPGGSQSEIMASLRRLGELEGDLTVYPGHEGFSTLDAERRSNPYLRMALAR